MTVLFNALLCGYSLNKPTTQTELEFAMSVINLSHAFFLRYRYLRPNASYPWKPNSGSVLATLTYLNVSVQLTDESVRLQNLLNRTLTVIHKLLRGWGESTLTSPVARIVMVNAAREVSYFHRRGNSAAVLKIFDILKTWLREHKVTGKIFEPNIVAEPLPQAPIDSPEYYDWFLDDQQRAKERLSIGHSFGLLRRMGFLMSTIKGNSEGRSPAVLKARAIRHVLREAGTHFDPKISEGLRLQAKNEQERLMLDVKRQIQTKDVGGTEPAWVHLVVFNLPHSKRHLNKHYLMGPRNIPIHDLCFLTGSTMQMTIKVKHFDRMRKHLETLNLKWGLVRKPVSELFDAKKLPDSPLENPWKLSSVV